MTRALITRLSSSDFIRGSVVFTSASFAVSLLHYAFNLLIARGFTLSAYGEYMSALSYIAILSVPFSAFNAIIINRIGRAAAQDRTSVALGIEKWLFRSLYRHAVKIVLGSCLLFGFFYLKTNIMTVSAIFILASVLLSIFGVLYSAVLQAYKTFAVAGAFGLGIAICKLLLGSTVVYLSPSIELLYGILIFVNMLTVVVGSILIHKRHTSENSHQILGTIRSYWLRKQVWLPTLTMFGIVGMLNLDVIFVKKFFEPDQAGLYVGLSLLGKIILYVTGPLSLVALTFFSSTEHSQKSRKILLLSIVLNILIGIPATIVYFLASELVVNVIFGAKFLEIASLAWLAAVFGSLYSIVSLFGQYAISRHSYFGLFSLVGLAIQFFGLYYFHESFYHVFMVNICTMAVVTLLYSFSIIQHEKKAT